MDIPNIPNQLNDPQDERERVAEIQNFIQVNRRLLNYFAKDTSLQFKLGDGFRIDTSKGEVFLDQNWFAEKDYTNNQILWAFFHEITHFTDKRNDLEGSKEVDQYIFDTSLEYAKEIEPLIKDDVDPKILEHNIDRMVFGIKRVWSKLEIVMLKTLFGFINSLDDIYVNHTVAIKAPKYSPNTSAGKEIIRLYNDKLFPYEKPYTDIPLHLQLSYKLLREAMVPGQEVVVSKEVQDIFYKKFDIIGTSFNLQQIIDQYVKPGPSNEAKMGDRLLACKDTIYPEFKKLLIKDVIEEVKRIKEMDEDLKDFEELFEKFRQQYESFTPDQLPETIEPENTNEKDRDKNKGGAGKGEGGGNIEAEDKLTKKYYEDLKEMQPYISELVEAWNKVVAKSKKINKIVESGFKSGDLSIDNFINQYAKIEYGDLDDVRIMNRDRYKQSEENLPEEIRLRILGDGSGSMNGEKIQTLRKIFVMINSSVPLFNTLAKVNKKNTQLKSQLIKYGEGANELLKLESTGDFTEESIDAYKRMTARDGKTNDFLALEMVNESLSEQDLRKIKERKIVEIVILICDGDSDDEESSKTAIDKMIDNGVIPIPIMLDKYQLEHEDQFQRIWINDRKNPGIRLKDVQELPGIIKNVIVQIFEGMR